MSISIGSSYDEPVDTAVKKAIAAGVTVVAAAGNSINTDACDTYPASTDGLISAWAVGTYTRDANGGVSFSPSGRAFFSNYGPCVSIFAPGSRIVSASNDSDTFFIE
jgi:serine protease